MIYAYSLLIEKLEKSNAMLERAIQNIEMKFELKEKQINENQQQWKPKTHRDDLNPENS